MPTTSCDAGSGSWANTGDANGTGPDLADSTSKFPFETSGMNAGAAPRAGPPPQPAAQPPCGAVHAQRLAADPRRCGCAEFTLTNGVYQPTIIMEARAPAPLETVSWHARNLHNSAVTLQPQRVKLRRAAQAGKIYRWRIVQASISKWMDVSLDVPGCTLGLYARDGNLLRALPRPVTNIMAAAANRLELLVACAAGDYKLRTGYGPLVPDAQCMSTHCELIKDVIANIKVVRGRSPRRRLRPRPHPATGRPQGPLGPGQVPPNARHGCPERLPAAHRQLTSTGCAPCRAVTLRAARAGAEPRHPVRDVPAEQRGAVPAGLPALPDRPAVRSLRLLSRAPCQTGQHALAALRELQQLATLEAGTCAALASGSPCARACMHAHVSAVTPWHALHRWWSQRMRGQPGAPRQACQAGALDGRGQRR